MKRGILNINDVAAYTALIFIALIIYLLFYLSALNLEEDYNSDYETTALAGHGALLLRVYLETPLDAPFSSYNTEGLDTPETVKGEVRDFLGNIFEDQACRDWLASKKGTSPTPSCRAFSSRSIAYFQSSCDDYRVRITHGEHTVELGEGISDYLKNKKHESLLLMHPHETTSRQSGWVNDILATATAKIWIGTYTVMGDEPILLRAVCVPRTEAAE
jgi:hypothetical protein